MEKLTLKKLAAELNSNNIACSIGKTVDKIFLDNIKDGYMAYIFDGDFGFSLVVRLRDESNKALDFKAYTPEQKAKCDEYKAELVAELNETEVYEFKGGVKKSIPVAPIEDDEENTDPFADQ